MFWIEETSIEYWKGIGILPPAATNITTLTLSPDRAENAKSGSVSIAFQVMIAGRRIVGLSTGTLCTFPAKYCRRGSSKREGAASLARGLRGVVPPFRFGCAKRTTTLPISQHVLRMPFPCESLWADSGVVLVVVDVAVIWMKSPHNVLVASLRKRTQMERPFEIFWSTFTTNSRAMICCRQRAWRRQFTRLRQSSVLSRNKI
ncbi:hypothetical protein M413DRAFT_437886, partial [Hebeloma cylindrosporum]